MTGFFRSLDSCLQDIIFTDIYEAGCGEGYVTAHIGNYYGNGGVLHASDISEECIEKAKKQCPQAEFIAGSIYEIKKPSNSYDLVIACEVLEHLDEPAIAMNELLRLSKKYVLVSVPNEPIWRICNVLRGKYLFHLGNTPGHIKHWSASSFFRFVGTHCKVLKQENPLPWTMLLCEK